MKTRLVFVLGLTVALALAAFLGGVSVFAGTPYEEFSCEHRLVLDPEAVGADGGWVTTDPGTFHTEMWHLQFQDRALFVTTSELTLTETSETSSWSCYFNGQPTQSRIWELLTPLRPAYYIQVDGLGDFESQWVGLSDPTWTPVPTETPTTEPTPVPTETPIPTETPTPEPTVVPTATPVVTTTPELPAAPLVVDFNVNSPEGFGQVVTTTQQFDLVAGIRATEEVSQEVILGFYGIRNPDLWEMHSADGVGGTWEVSTETQSILWLGPMPSEGFIELWLHSPANVVRPQETAEFGLIVAALVEEGSYEPVTRTVWVRNPIYAVFLPLVGQNFAPVTQGAP